MRIEAKHTVGPINDERFWQAAYRDHAPAVMSFLMRRLGRREEAEDILQETFVRVMRVDPERGDNLRGYLLRTARNLLVNRIRRPRLVVSAQPREDEQPFADVAAETASPERETALNTFRNRLEQALATLKQDHRKAFELAALEQYSYGEIARLTGWSLPQVKSNVHRARKKLIDRLGPYLADARGSL